MVGVEQGEHVSEAGDDGHREEAVLGAGQAVEVEVAK